MIPDFDSWLEGQLRLSLGPERGPRPHPAQARYRTAGRSAIPAALATRVAAGGAVAALAAGAVTAAAVTATGSANPIAFGQRVIQALQQCKEEARSTSTGAPRNVGQCISAFAREQGEQQSDDHERTPGPSPKPGQREGQEGGAQRGNGSGAAGANHGQGQGHQDPPASPGPPAGHGSGDHGHAKPTPKPAT